MSDEPALTPPEQPVTDYDLPQPAPAPRTAQRHLAPWLYGIGFLILAGAVFYVWRYPTTPAEVAAGASDIHAIQQKLESIDERISRLEQAPSGPTAADLAKLSARLDSMETRISDQTRLASRLDVLSGRIDSMSGREQTGLDAIKQQRDQDAGRITSLEKTIGNVEGVSDRVNRIVRIQAAEVALAGGQPIGDVPGAPPALSRFAHSAPPTLEQLRLEFAQVERAALAAQQSTTASAPFVDRVWERAQGLVTVRQGDQVVVGNSSAVAIARARAALDAGDLNAAVDATAMLSPNALSAAADWLAKAKALIDARSALADITAHT